MAQEQELTSDEHFSVDETGNPSVDFYAEQRMNETHQSTTDPEAKGKGMEIHIMMRRNYTR